MLYFIYNARSGMGHAALDSLHKIISPSTYRCDLCRLTHHAFGMRKEWKAFVEEFRTAEIGFVHRDEFWQLPCGEKVSEMPLPVIGYCSGSYFQVLITAVEMAELKDVSALITLLKKRTKKSRIL